MLNRRRALQLALAAAATCISGCGAGPQRRVYPWTEMARGLRFPEGPIALADGSIVLVEIARSTLTRVDSAGRVEVVATLNGGPNGAAIGPNGKCYVCNNGGEKFTEIDGMLIPVGRSDEYTGGWIERVDLRTGHAEVLYREIDGKPLSAPNDLVFDGLGGFWFTDMGKSDAESRRHGALCYARADGTKIERVVPSMSAPNGIGLAPGNRTLYVAELLSARLLAFDLEGAGRVALSGGMLPGRHVGTGPGRAYFDSLAVEAGGNVCVASPLLGEIVVFSPDGTIVETVPVPDALPTNLCFGGGDLRTAYVTLAGSGRLISMEWPRAGLRLAHSS